jgi:hypothetical protein
MTDEQHPPQESPDGWIEAASRIVRVLIESGRAQENLQVILGAIDPDSGAKLVQAALGTDPALPLAVLGALPDAANAAIEVTDALIAEVGRHPPELVRGAARALLGSVRFRRLGQGAGRLLGLALRLTEGAADDAQDLGAAFAAGADEIVQREAGVPAAAALASVTLAGAEVAVSAVDRALAADRGVAEAVQTLAGGLEQLLDRHPAVRRQVLLPLLDAVRGPS